MNHKRALLITGLVAVIWSLAGLNIKLIQWPSFAIAGGRSIIAVLLLTPLLLKVKKENPKVNILDKYVLGGAVCFVIFNYCFIASTKLTTSAIAIMMQYTAPVYVALLSRMFLKERIFKSDIVSIACVLIGIVFFFLDSTGGGTVGGNIIAGFNGVSFAGISIFLRLQKNGVPFLSMYFGNVLAGIMGLPFIFQAGIPNMPSFIYLLLAGTSVALTYTLYANASKSLSALETVLLPIIDPMLNPVWVWLILGEKPGLLSILGCIIILLSVSARVISGLRTGH